MQTAPQPRQAAMVFIMITIFLDILGVGIIVPILPELIKQFLDGDTAQAARYFGAIAAVYALMQFLFAPIWGALSDKFGRRPIILLSDLGLALDYLIQGFAPTIGWLFLGRVLAGVMGASFTAANAYIADVSTPENRAQNFGLVGVAFGLGFIVGPLLGGVLGAISLRLPFFVAAGLVVVNLLYGFFVLPESLSAENRSGFSWRKANPISSIAGLKSYPLVSGLAIAFMFASLAQRGLENVWVLYTGYSFGWDERANGYALGLVGVMAVIVQGFLIRPAIKRFGERRAIVLGLSFSALSFAAYGLATQGWMMLVIIVVGSLSGVAAPAIQGLVAGVVAPSEQGKVQGALTSLTSLTSIIAPLLFTSLLFGYFTSDAAPFVLPGAPFFLGSLLFVTALILMTRLFKRVPPTAPKDEDEPDESGVAAT